MDGWMDGWMNVTFRDSTLNTANLCPAISVVGLFLLTYCVYEFCVLVYFRQISPAGSGFACVFSYKTSANIKLVLTYLLTYRFGLRKSYKYKYSNSTYRHNFTARSRERSTTQSTVIYSSKFLDKSILENTRTNYSPDTHMQRTGRFQANRRL